MENKIGKSMCGPVLGPQEATVCNFVTGKQVVVFAMSHVVPLWVVEHCKSCEWCRELMSEALDEELSAFQDGKKFGPC